MKRLTTLALLAGMLSAPALHSEETPPDALPPLNFPLPAKIIVVILLLILLPRWKLNKGMELKLKSIILQ